MIFIAIVFSIVTSLASLTYANASANASSISAAASADSGSTKPDSTNSASPAAEVVSVPYPNGLIYLEKGLSGAFLGGKHRNFGDKRSIFQWQGDLSYFYTPHFSAGVSFKITAGEPSDTTAKIVNRYFVQCRLHQSYKNFAIYIGPQLGMENLNIIKGNIPDSLSPRAIKNPIQPISPDTKPSVGLDFGLGYKLCPWFGLTYGNTLEFSFVGENGEENTLNLHFNPGIAVDVLSFAKSLRKLVNAMYIIVELQNGMLLNEATGHQRDRSIIGGIDLAF